MRATARNAILDELRQLGPPEPRVADEAGVVDPWRDGPPDTAAVRNRRFQVRGRNTKLVPPIDWLQDPHDSRSWRYQLHTLAWLRPTIERHAIGGDPDALAAACDVVVDWARRHVGDSNGGEVSEFAWYDMAVGLRAPYLAYVLRAGLHDGTLGDDSAALLLHAAQRHGDELAEPDNYAAGHNHGLYQDEGLYLLARQLPALPLAEGWIELARGRLRSTLLSTVSFDEGAHLEHSTAYQFAMVNLVARLAANVDGVPELDELLARLRRTAAWHVTPAGRLVQLGDTDDVEAPAWARDASTHLRGLRALFEAGQAFVRDGDSYLAVGAAYHGPGHKQADDSGFVLVENGRVVLGDAGRWGYYEREPDRLYARSSRAHNVLTVDGQDFDWRDAEPYGSGLIAAGKGDGWYAIVVSNRLLRAQGVEHRRLLLYRPAEVLLVIDDVQSEQPHDYARHFHFGPGLDAEMVDGHVAVGETGRDTVADAAVATLVDTPGAGAAGGDPAAPVSISLIRARDNPDRLGWTYPADRKRISVWTATLRSRGRSATFAAALSLTGGPLTVEHVAADAAAATVELDDRRLALTLEDRRVSVAERTWPSP